MLLIEYAVRYEILNDLLRLTAATRLWYKTRVGKHSEGVEVGCETVKDCEREV